MIAGPDPDYADCVMSQETTVADYTSPHTPPRVRVQVGNVECTALVDTGSRANLISQELYDFIANDEESAHPGIHGQLENVGGALHGAGTEQLPLVGAVALNVRLSATKSFRARFLVADRLMTDMLWGDHLLGPDHLGTVIDLRKRTIWSRTLNFEMKLEHPVRPASPDVADPPRLIRSMYAASYDALAAASVAVRSLSSLTAEDERDAEMSETDDPTPPEDQAATLAREWLSRLPTKGSRRQGSDRPRATRGRARKLVRCGMVLDSSPTAESQRAKRSRRRASTPPTDGADGEAKRPRSRSGAPPSRVARSLSIHSPALLRAQTPAARSLSEASDSATGVDFSERLATLAQQAEEAQEQCERCDDVMSRKEGRRLASCICREATDRLHRARLRADAQHHEWNAMWLNGDYVWRPCRVAVPRVPSHVAASQPWYVEHEGVLNSPAVTPVGIHTDDGGFVVVHPAFVRAYDEDVLHRRPSDGEIENMLSRARRTHPADSVEHEIAIMEDAQSGAAQVSPIDDGVLSEAQLLDLWSQWESEPRRGETAAEGARPGNRQRTDAPTTVLLTSPTDERPRESYPSVPHLTMPAWCAQEPREPPSHLADDNSSGPALMSPIADDLPSGTRILVYSRSTRMWRTARYVRRDTPVRVVVEFPEGLMDVPRSRCRTWLSSRANQHVTALEIRLLARRETEDRAWWYNLPSTDMLCHISRDDPLTPRSGAKLPTRND